MRKHKIPHSPESPSQLHQDKSVKTWLKDAWYFVWEDDSWASWFVNLVLAIIIIKFIFFPGIGLLLNTSHPVVAVVSSSMEHHTGFDQYWNKTGNFYEGMDISRDTFADFPLYNGFYKGDIIVLQGDKEVAVGDIIVFWSSATRPRNEPIIHRVIASWDEDGTTYYRTKGDNWLTNPDSLNNCNTVRMSACIDETRIAEDRVIGQAVFRIPFLGYVKVAFLYLLSFFMF